MILISHDAKCTKEKEEKEVWKVYIADVVSLKSLASLAANNSVNAAPGLFPSRWFFKISNFCGVAQFLHMANMSIKWPTLPDD